MKHKNAVTLLLMLLLSAEIYGQTADAGTAVYKRGTTYMESTLPPTPEAASAVKYVDIPLQYDMGVAHLDVPLYELAGKEISVPISLGYASSGIKMDEIAGVAGLGWALNAGGCITRTVMDMPDEFSSDIFHHQLPSEALLAKLEDINNNDAEKTGYLTAIVRHKIDSKLDRYSYCACGLSGSFVITDDGRVEQLSGEGVRISFKRDASGAVCSFSITGPDGSIYTFSEKETGTHDATNGNPPDLLSGERDVWTAVTAWYITSITSRSGLEHAEFSYEDGPMWQKDLISHSSSITMSTGGDNSNPYGTSISTIARSYTTKLLKSITLAGERVTFSYSSATGSTNHMGVQDRNYPVMLREIAVKTNKERELRKFIIRTEREPHDGRVILRSLTLKGSGGKEYDRWAFEYNTKGHQVFHYAQDWYGYYNGASVIPNNGAAPFSYSPSPALVCGTPDASEASYMSLASCTHNGAVTDFKYEGNGIGSGSNATSIGIRVASIADRSGPSLSGNDRMRSFIYESPWADGPYMPSPSMYTTVAAPFTKSDMTTGSVTWTFILHENPVTSGPSIKDTRIYYGKITEIISRRELSLPPTVTKTIRYYDTSITGKNAVNVFGNFPSAAIGRYNQYPPCMQGYDPLDGIRTDYYDEGPVSSPVLTRQEEYACDVDGVTKLVYAASYSYDIPVREDILIDYVAQQVWHPSGIGAISNEYVYHYPVYASRLIPRNMICKSHVRYHAEGRKDSTSTAISYVPRGTDLEMPARISAVSSSEGGMLRRTVYTYADGSDGPFAKLLRDQHFVTTPVKTEYGICKNMAQTPDLNGVPCIDAASVSPVPYKTEILSFDNYDIGGLRAMPSCRSELTQGAETWREEIISRDCCGNVRQIKERGKPNTVILWSYNGKYPVAVIENASLSQVSGNLRILGCMNTEDPLDILTKSDIPDGDMIAAVDALRELMPYALVRTFTFAPGIGIVSMTDANGVKTAYEYDYAGRLSAVRDADGNLMNDYEYDLLDDDGDGRLSVLGRAYRSASGDVCTADKTWWSTTGLRLQDIAICASGNGDDLVTAYGSDFMMHDDVKTWLPFPAQHTDGDFQEDAELKAESFHSSSKAYVYKRYEISARDRIAATAAPGFACEHENTMDDDAAIGFQKYRWTADGVTPLSPYDAWEIAKTSVTDADGRIRTTFTDHTGRILGTSCGTDAPTYYIYDDLDRLRAVSGSGIEIHDTLSMWRYSYDRLGRLSSKGIPGCIREEFTYDDEDRVSSISKGNIIKEFEYDSLGRVIRVYLTDGRTYHELIEEHTYRKNMMTGSRIAIMGIGGGIVGYVTSDYSYDDKARPIRTSSLYPDGSVICEELTYNFPGETVSSVITCKRGNVTDSLTGFSSYDVRGRVKSEDCHLYTSGAGPASACTVYEYDSLGRLYKSTTTTADGISVSSVDTYSLQGWLSSRRVTLNGRETFYESLSREEGASPSYTGLVTSKQERRNSEAETMASEEYAYDYAGRLSREQKGISLRQACLYSYDARGNILSVTDFSSAGAGLQEYVYDGDMLTGVLEKNRGTVIKSYSFTHDNAGRMTFDGLLGIGTEYNHLDLPAKVTRNGSVLANYCYLADGTKESSLKESGQGLVYRGPFTYRRDADGTLSLESARYNAGRMVPGKVMIHVTDHLGSVRQIVDGTTAGILECSGYSAYGRRTDETPARQAVTETVKPGATGSATITFRDHFTGKEDQMPEFGIPYSDYGARMYSPQLRRWMIVDPLSEKYYGISPYAYCLGNPILFDDYNGKDIVLAGKNKSSLTVRTDLINRTFSVADMGIDWHGNHTIEGAEALGAALDIAGIFDPTGIADIANAGLQFWNREYMDGFISVAGVIPYFGDLAKISRVSKNCNVLSDVASAVSGGAKSGFRAFTSRNFRHNLAKRTGINPQGMEAHHMPQKFEREFRKTGIDINDPKYGKWVEKHEHRKGAYWYNQQWEKFFKKHETRPAFFEDIMKKLDEINN